MTLISSSVSLPHFSLTLPLICFQFPSTRFQSMWHSCWQSDHSRNVDGSSEVPAALSLFREHAGGLDSTCQRQHDDDDQEHTHDAAGPISPSAAVTPCRQRADQ